MKARHKDGRETDEITDEEFYRTYQPAGFTKMTEVPNDEELTGDGTGEALPEADESAYAPDATPLEQGDSGDEDQPEKTPAKPSKKA